MKYCASLSLLLVALLILGACEQPVSETTPAGEAATEEGAAAEVADDPTPDEIVATGVIMGRSGQPMAKARLVLAQVAAGGQFSQARLVLADEVSTVTADEEGRFEFKGFVPGKYTIMYQPAGPGGVFPVELNIRSLTGTDKSITPLLRNFELGKDKPYDNRVWGRDFTLLKGHTLYSKGETMVAWNATARRGKGGPYMEMRRGRIWTEEFEDNSEIEFETWSY